MSSPRNVTEVSSNPAGHTVVLKPRPTGDHLLLASDLHLTLLKARRKTLVCQAPFDTTRLIQDSAVQQQCAVTVQNKFDGLGTLPDNVDTHWDSFSSIIRSSADTVVGVRKNTRKPWLSAETFDVIEHKVEARRQNNHVERKHLRGIFKAKAKADHELYLKASQMKWRTISCTTKWEQFSKALNSAQRRIRNHSARLFTRLTAPLANLKLKP